MPHTFDRKIIIALVLWAFSVSAGFVWVNQYKAEEGLPSTPPVSLPGNSQGQLPKLMMFVHPKCFCSQASLNELARLLGDSPVKPAVNIVFADGFDAEETRNSALWQQARRITGATVSIDDDARLASALQVATSGDTLLYSAEGRLLFHGGITPSRGHEGDSLGRLRLLAAINGEKPDEGQSSVFGCPLDNPPDNKGSET